MAVSLVLGWVRCTHAIAALIYLQGIDIEEIISTVHPGHDAWVVGDKPCVALDFAVRSSSVPLV